MNLPSRPHLLALCLGAALLVGSQCPSQPILSIVEPVEGAVLEGCSVAVLVSAKGTSEPGTLTADLNGVAVPLVPHPVAPKVFEAVIPVDPASGLAAQNTLTVSVEGDGNQTTKSVSFQHQPEAPQARQITDSADLITGPHGDSRIGDWLLENCVARFVVQDAPARDLTGIGQYGGNLIDMERRDTPGRESFFEVQPMINIETVVNAEIVEIVNDGSDGNPAIVRSCGPDDPMDYINANTLVDDLLGPGSFPASADDVDQPVRACTEYIVDDRSPYVEMVTTLENLGSETSAHYIGDYLNGSGGLEQWTNRGAANNPFGLSSLIGEMTATVSFGAFSFHGYGRNEGVSYAYIPIPLEGSPAPSSSFTQTGVSAVLHSNAVISVLFLGFPPTFSVPVGESRSFTRFVGVGSGSASEAIDQQLSLLGTATKTIHGCVTVGGDPAPGARVAIGTMNATTIVDMASHFVADATGCYRGNVPAGIYGLAAAKKGVPYEGGGATPIFHSVDLVNNDIVEQNVALPATGRVEVSVSDASGAPIPARIGIVGTDPSPELLNSFTLAGVLDIDTSLFHDATDDPIPDGLAWVQYAGADGQAGFDLEPGSYDLWVSRGSEYSAYSESINVAAAPAAPVTVAAQIARVVDTSGFLSSDFHVHMIKSSDSTISNEDRVEQFAGEGVDNIVATDHDRHTDLDPIITDRGLAAHVGSIVGEEITTFDYGHFNAYPLGLDPDRVTGGSTDWARGAPIGEGFPASCDPGAPPLPFAPSYTRLPGEIFDEVMNAQKVAGGVLNDSPSVAVQVNHFGSHYGPLKIDTASLPLRSQLSAAERCARRFDPAAPDEDFFFAFPALELWNGHTRGHQSEFLDARIGVWMNLLNLGIKTTGIFDTDTHAFFTVRSGGARSWTPASNDDPALFDGDEVGAAVLAGKVVGGQGIYVQARLVATNDTNNAADFSLAGSSQLTTTDGEVTLEIDIQAPTWAPYDTIEIYRNATTSVAGSNGGVPVDYTAIPTQVLESFTGDFNVATVTVDESVPGADRFESSLSLPFSVAQDSWFIVIVKGTDANSASMFPVMPASVGQNGGVRALGATNALYVDVDGNGVFDAPGLSVSP